MDNQKLSILKMIESGRVTAEEGLKLLDVVDGPRRRPLSRDFRRVRILVSELGSGRRRAQANLPLSLVDLGLGLAARAANRSISIAGRPIDAQDLRDAIRTGGPGRILEFSDDEENVRVEVFIE